MSIKWCGGNSNNFEIWYIEKNLFSWRFNEGEAVVLATWIEKHYPNQTCFIDSFAWGSADQLLKEIDNKYCWKKHSKTYDYQKRNFMTSPVHAFLSTSLLDIIESSKICIFIESQESVSLANGLRKNILTLVV